MLTMTVEETETAMAMRKIEGIEFLPEAWRSAGATAAVPARFLRPIPSPKDSLRDRHFKDILLNLK
jgi:hypothetical protein